MVFALKGPSDEAKDDGVVTRSEDGGEGERRVNKMEARSSSLQSRELI